jgi:hypothetical protein
MPAELDHTSTSLAHPVASASLGTQRDHLFRLLINAATPALRPSTLVSVDRCS